ncbi:DUF805 domain-containing protein [Macrococcus equi]|uniref:DUF805 domain-containing protein n=1 Tax=Macrococcus equi TaxID=3395462 RepID=UPI0039BE281D
MQNNMSMKDAVIAFWTKGFQFSGRARRSEYWLNVVAMILIGLLFWGIFSLVDVFTGQKFHLQEHYHFFSSEIIPYITAIPGMAQASRRLQDININGIFAIVIIAFGTIISFISTHVFPIFPIDFTNMGGMTSLVVFSLITVIPWLFLFICNFIRGNHGPNQYGEDPKQVIS